ncbi:hypothetical protein D9T11_19350 [Enterobacter kobei]|nr:hypothetical protein D9T11_19350 [Enterobacter kobei]
MTYDCWIFSGTGSGFANVLLAPPFAWSKNFNKDLKKLWTYAVLSMLWFGEDRELSSYYLELRSITEELL